MLNKYHHPVIVIVIVIVAGAGAGAAVEDNGDNVVLVVVLQKGNTLQLNRKNGVGDFREATTNPELAVI